MSGQHDEHGQTGHGGHGGIGEWLHTHMGGMLTPFGERFEKLLEQTMVLIVSGFVLWVGIACLIIVAPVILLEFAIHVVQS